MIGKSAYLEQIIAKRNSTCNMQVVFVDIVAYSRRKSHAQVGVINAFQECLEAALSATEQHFPELRRQRRLALRDNVILIPAGDGVAVGFPFEGLHDIHLVFATSLLTAIGTRSAAANCPSFRQQGWCDCHDAMLVRIGVSAGMLIIYKDINDNFNLAGTTINVAARVMGVASNSQILFSEAAHHQIIDMIRGIGTRFVEYNGVVVKHGLTLNVYQYVDKNLKYLNSGRSEVLDNASKPHSVDAPITVTRRSPTTDEAPHKGRRQTPGNTRGRRGASSVKSACQDALDRLIAIPPGEFLIGGKRPVIIPRSFLIDRYAMTQDLYRQVMGASQSQFKGDRLPVDSASWLDAVTFCNALSRLCKRGEVYELDGQSVAINYDNQGFRLPTEAEWEYACGAGGLTPDGTPLPGVAWHMANAKQTQDVGQRRANANGLYDMLGNVWEWCNDWYENRSPESIVSAPIGPPEGLERVVRGGSWNDLAATISPTYRGARNPSLRATNIGFRIAATT